MTVTIETTGLTRYFGSSPGIVDLDLEVRVGDVHGFIGPNGAGKSTTIRTLLNFLFPSEGSGTVLGLDIIKHTLEIRRQVGYVPGDLSIYDAMTACEFLIYFTSLRKCDCTTVMDSLAGRVQLDLDRKIKDYSTGNRQKIGMVNVIHSASSRLVPAGCQP